MLILIELGLTLTAVAIAFLYPALGANWFRAIERPFVRLAQRRRLAVVVVGVTALAARAAVLPILPIPQPGVHDEFGYLLAADTFAHGRLTNPTHPMWVHFETFSIIQKPTYQCFAQPAQGIVLAAGQVIAGHPFWGVWLSAGLMCAAICWMLQGWLPAGWALLGGFLAVIRLATFSYWANSYWGGAVAATGGALVLGALPRIKSSQRVQDALLMGLGLAILASSRPYDGLVFCLPVAGALLAWMLRKEAQSLGSVVRCVVAPLLLVLAVTGCALGYYFWRVTGSPFRMPYQVARDTYAVAPYFVWQSLKPAPVYHHAVMREFYVGWEGSGYMAARSLVGCLINIIVNKPFTFWAFYLGPLLTLPLVTAVLTGPRRFLWRRISQPTRFLLVLGGICFVGSALEVFEGPHYESPATCLILAVVLTAMRYLRGWQPRGKPTGLAIVRLLPVAAVMLLVPRAAATRLHLPTPSSPQTWSSPGQPMFDRARVLSQLRGEPGPQLVIVRYSGTHSLFREWVFNSADIDASKVVWARDMGAAQNEELLHYFKDRTIWLLEADGKPPRLSVYPGDQILSGR